MKYCPLSNVDNIKLSNASHSFYHIIKNELHWKIRYPYYNQTLNYFKKVEKFNELLESDTNKFTHTDQLIFDGSGRYNLHRDFDKLILIIPNNIYQLTSNIFSKWREHSEMETRTKKEGISKFNKAFSLSYGRLFTFHSIKMNIIIHIFTFTFIKCKVKGCP